MVSFGFVPLSLNNGFRSELKQLETQKSKKKIKALIGITAQDKNQLLHRYFILSQFLLLRKTLGKIQKPLEPLQYFQYSLTLHLNVIYIVAHTSTPNFALI